ncbi:Hsp20/alpha crystallin family protein [Aliifodinibius sp. S!AR15-10]|uniref:Hsp20/alpha crystallin family protein n=1 Tax=Aliifodinibius sp. S!AR15-10 TaxID=2950437 RepID=UPI002864C8BD|nr:Hsp20/alpha crystallin family protein [Aliifodinibius sp. S!AR15-10]MDR8393107.1 Hsp20/alpha crystallin family protein [Aliifodinibius sp. S!AR15-10]
MSEFVIDIEKQLNRLGRDIQNLVERIVPLEDKGHDFTPTCDIIESEEHFKLLLDLPGLSKKEIHIALKDHVLTVKGERVEELSDDESYKRQERKSGVFSRSFALPENVNAAETEATFRNGVLTIKMPKSDVLKDSKSIPIK